MLCNNYCRMFVRIYPIGHSLRTVRISRNVVSVLFSTRQYSLVKPGAVSPLRTLPGEIVKPSYTSKSWFNFHWESTKKAEIKGKKQIQGMKDACRLAREILLKAGDAVRPGVTTDQIDELVHNTCIAHGAYPSPLLYKRFPKSVCTSVNNVACHGIPDDRPLEDGDIINIDVTVYYRGYHGDTSDTFLVGSVDIAGRQLVDHTRRIRDKAIEICGPGVSLSAIGQVISTAAEEVDLDVIPDFCGHGIGSYFHELPNIIHVENDFSGTMEEGMTFTIEPIITEGDPSFTILDDGWTAVSDDDSRSAQAEHSVLITENGPQILTVI